MSLVIRNSVCDHDWVEYDDEAAYNDGFHCPTVAICSRCGARRDIRNREIGITGPIWYENFMRLYVSILVVIYRVTIAPIVMLIRFIKDKVVSKNKERLDKKAG